MTMEIHPDRLFHLGELCLPITLEMRLASLRIETTEHAMAAGRLTLERELGPRLVVILAADLRAVGLDLPEREGPLPDASVKPVQEIQDLYTAYALTRGNQMYLAKLQASRKIDSVIPKAGGHLFDLVCGACRAQHVSIHHTKIADFICTCGHTFDDLPKPKVLRKTL